MRGPYLLGLLVVCLFAGAVSAKDARFELIQPTQSRTDILLKSSPGHAVVERRGAGPQRVPVRPTEQLTTITETSTGWVVAGFAEEKGATELIILQREGGGLRRLAPPALKRHDLRLAPALLAPEGDDLEAIAWLEGPHLQALSVRAATWREDGWGEVDIVAPRARGSQTGLVAAHLADGRALLAWSAFDGQDDDILWSVGGQQRWSRPARVSPDDRAPDISPTLVATRSGALLAWSKMVDGHYMVLMASFDGSSWSAPRPVGPAGSVAPKFVDLDGQIHLLYRNAWPRAWVVNDFSSGRRLDRTVILPDRADGRPVLERTASGTAQLRFPGGRRDRIHWEAVP